ncbi:MAG: hypothetical protein ACKOHO_05650, partial [Acidimicrobiaceae bacterium]
MTRSAVGRFRRTVSPLTGAICCISLVLGIAPATAGATGAAGVGAKSQLATAGATGAGGWVQTSDQKQREVEAILDELDRLEEQMDQLAEDYAEALNDGIELDKEIA